MELDLTPLNISNLPFTWEETIDGRIYIYVGSYHTNHCLNRLWLRLSVNVYHRPVIGEIEARYE